MLNKEQLELIKELILKDEFDYHFNRENLNDEEFKKLNPNDTRLGAFSKRLIEVYGYSEDELKKHHPDIYDTVMTVSNQ